MTPALRTPLRRIILAVALSVLIHCAILWLPRMSPPHTGMAQTLTVTLQPLAKAPAITATVPTQQQAAVPPAASIAAIAPAPSAARPPRNAPQPAVGNPSTADNAADIPSEQLSRPQPSNLMDPKTELAASQSSNVLPRHAQLKFAVYNGGLRTGEALHQLEISNGEYILKAVQQTAGLAQLVGRYQSIQTSHGTADQAGLQPRLFTEHIIDGDTHEQSASFDWTAQQLHFSSGETSDLAPDTQDALSVFYQLSQLSLHREIIPLTVSNGNQLQKYELEIGAREEIATPMGTLRAVHLRKLHMQQEGYFEIWLGVDFRMLPVRILYTEPSGRILEELLVSDIFISDQ